MRIVIGIPASESPHARFALYNLPNIIAMTKAAHPDWNIHVSTRQGVGTHLNRNAILQEIYEMPELPDYILWLDADMIYPPDILLRYIDDAQTLKIDPKIMGCLYVRRTPPFDPVAFFEGTDPERPFTPVPPFLLKHDLIYDSAPGFGPITGLGFGGMLVALSVYDSLGENKWMRYGVNFGIPDKPLDSWSHDLVFCDAARKAGHTLYLHGGVRPAHLATVEVTEKDWLRVKRDTPLKSHPKVAILLPATDKEQAQQAMDVMIARAGIPKEHIQPLIGVDTERKGFVATVNDLFSQIAPDTSYVVYTAQDAFAGQDWLEYALREALYTSSAVVALNDGKRGGRLPGFGLISVPFVKSLYDGKLMFPGYHSHFGDTELGQIAKAFSTYGYAKQAIMLEIDYNKAGKGKGGVVVADRQLYAGRCSTGFNDRVQKNHPVLAEFA